MLNRFKTGLVAAAVLLGGAGEPIVIDTIAAFRTQFSVDPASPERPVHAKGILLDGVFTPSPGAAALSRAPHFAGPPVRTLVRLDDYAGLADYPDAGPAAAPRGMSVRFLLPDGTDTDIVAHSYDGFPAATPEEFLGYIRAVTAGNAGALPGDGALDRFVDAHPAARSYRQALKPAPAAWANESFFGVNAFRFVNAEERGRFGRYRILPVDGDARLSAEEVAVANPNYLRQGLLARLPGRPVAWRVVVQLAADDDVTDDDTVHWATDRPVVELGVLQIDREAPGGVEAERAAAFSPLNLADGIERSADPILTARARAYGESLRQRSR